MEFDIKEGAGCALALLCSSIVLDLANFDYNMFMDAFVLWKVAVKIGTPMLFVLLWLAIYHLAFRLQNK